MRRDETRRSQVSGTEDRVRDVGIDVGIDDGIAVGIDDGIGR